jgi:hypothetical protein
LEDCCNQSPPTQAYKQNSFSLFDGIMKDDFECPWCGSNFENNKELHLHAQKHYEPLLCA